MLQCRKANYTEKNELDTLGFALCKLTLTVGTGCGGVPNLVTDRTNLKINFSKFVLLLVIWVLPRVNSTTMNSTLLIYYEPVHVQYLNSTAHKNITNFFAIVLKSEFLNVWCMDP